MPIQTKKQIVAFNMIGMLVSILFIGDAGGLPNHIPRCQAAQPCRAADHFSL